MNNRELCTALIRKLLKMILSFRLTEFGLQSPAADVMVEELLSPGFDIIDTNVEDRNIYLAAMSFVNPNLTRFIITYHERTEEELLRAEFLQAQQALGLAGQAAARIEEPQMREVVARAVTKRSKTTSRYIERAVQ